MSSSAAAPRTKAKLELNLVRIKKKNHDINGVRDASRQVSKFFATLGSQVESLIDASPLGVEDPEPWTPETNPTFAALSNPITALNEICEGLPGVNGAKQIFDSEGTEDGPLAAWASLLMNVRKGLENAVEAEKKLNLYNRDDMPVMVDVADADAVVPKQGGSDAFVDLGADKWGNSPRRSHPWGESVAEAKVIKKQVKNAVSNFTMNKFLPFVDNLTLRINGIVITSDDCSVECSVASLVDTVSDGECPSINTEQEDSTEIALEEFEDAVDTMKTAPDVEQVVAATPEGIKIEIDHSKEEKIEEDDNTSIEDEDFVMAEDEMEISDDEEFDLLDENFDVTSVN